VSAELDYLRHRPFLQYEDLTIVVAHPPSGSLPTARFRATHYKGEPMMGAVGLVTTAEFKMDPRYHRSFDTDKSKFAEARRAMREVPSESLAQLAADSEAWLAARVAYAQKNTFSEATRLAREYAVAKSRFESAVAAIESQNARLWAAEYSEDPSIQVLCPVTGLYASHNLEHLLHPSPL
jgi:hypothetical protein